MSPTDLLDLDYELPGTPTGLAERARRDGRRIRRRRRVAVAAAGTAALTVCSLVAVGAFTSLGGAATQTRPDTVWVGSSPTAGVSPTQTSVPAGLRPNRGRIPDLKGSHDTSQSQRPPAAGDVRPLFMFDGVQYVMWTSHGWHCLGTREDRAATPQAYTCGPLAGMPAEGFWAAFETSPDGSVEGIRSPTWIIGGYVRGKVDKVVVNLPDGDVEAHLVTPSAPDQATFYWVTTRAIDSGDRGVEQLGSVSRTAIRDGEPIYRCAGLDMRCYEQG